MAAPSLRIPVSAEHLKISTGHGQDIIDRDEGDTCHREAGDFDERQLPCLARRYRRCVSCTWQNDTDR